MGYSQTDDWNKGNNRKVNAGASGWKEVTISASLSSQPVMSDDDEDEQYIPEGSEC